MRHSCNEIITYLKDNQGPAPEYWATCFLKRKSLNKVLRDIKPIKVSMSYTQGSFYTTLKPTICDTGKPIDYCKNAYDSELNFFDTEQEAKDYYNRKIDDALRMVDIDISKLQNEKLKLEVLKID